MHPARLLDIIHEDPALLVVNKPADLVCHPTKGDVYSSLISRVRLHLGEDFEPQMIHRLDRETSGVMLLAKTNEVARGIRRQWEQGEVRKEYMAIAQGHLPEDHGIIDAPLGKDTASRVAIKDCVCPGGSPSQTEYRVERRFERAEGLFTLLHLMPRTGRKHQIRIHLASIGHPIVGDKLYGADEDLYLALVERRLTDAQREQLILPWHALHASSLRFQWLGESYHFCAPPEPWFLEFIGR